MSKKVLPPPVQRLINEFARLPGIGPKSASRLTFYLLRAGDEEQISTLADALKELKEKTQFCSVCFNITEADPCPLCNDDGREPSLLCVVEEPLDVLAIERSGAYNGRYHVLHGAISPVEGIGPEDLKLTELVQRLEQGTFTELIIATNVTLEGDSTAMYIQRRLGNLPLKLTRLARVFPSVATWNTRMKLRWVGPSRRPSGNVGQKGHRVHKEDTETHRDQKEKMPAPESPVMPPPPSPSERPQTAARPQTAERPQIAVHLSGRSLFWLLTGLGFLVVGGWLVVKLRPLLEALIVSGLLAYMLDPLVRQMEKRLGWPRSVITVIVCILLLFFLIGPLFWLGVVIVDEWGNIVDELLQVWQEVQNWLSQPLPILGVELYPEDFANTLTTVLQSTLSNLPAGTGGFWSDLTDNLIWLAVISISFFYFLKDGPKFKPTLINQLPTPYQPQARHLADKVSEIWGVFLRMQLLIFFIISILIIVSTGFIIWMFRQGWLPLSPFGLIILLILVYTGIQQLDPLWLRPRLMGQSLNLHTGVVLIGLLAALALSGVLGALLVVPALATVKFLVGYGYQQWLDSNTAVSSHETETEPKPDNQPESESKSKA